MTAAGSQPRHHVRQQEPVAAAVLLVRQHRAADELQVDADLVRPPGPRLYLHQRVPAEPLQHLVVAARVLGVRVGGVGGSDHLLPLPRVVLEPRLDVVAVPPQLAGRQGDILLVDLARLELQRQFPVRHLVLGDQDDAAGVPVKPVDDPWAEGAVGPAEPVLEAERQGVRQGAGPVAAGRVDDHVGRLVHQRDRLVLVKNVERDVFWDDDVVDRLGQLDAEPVLVADLVTRLGRPAVDRDVPALDRLLKLGAAEVREVAVQELVEPRPLALDADDHLDRVAGPRVRGRLGDGDLVRGDQLVVEVRSGHGGMSDGRHSAAVRVG
jgi:hypothetical protein